jgi:hypothetical protein
MLQYEFFNRQSARRCGSITDHQSPIGNENLVFGCGRAALSSLEFPLAQKKSRASRCGCSVGGLQSVNGAHLASPKREIPQPFEQRCAGLVELGLAPNLFRELTGSPKVGIGGGEGFWLR